MLQSKEIKFYQDLDYLEILVHADPYALVVWVDDIEATISDCSELQNKDQYQFKSVYEFLEWRLSELNNDLNALADELGYNRAPGIIDRSDFIFDLIANSNDNFEEFKDWLAESYNCYRLEDRWDD
ncbi:hypothetical protein FC52_GL000883 [Lactobacillus pasteurii DSM 23907 = CRBIP 24.76]|uniref:Uncharacterized protein n=1 Tax=Lactobacillus pasteurii DSM 23907 = CRBIP 24.76 TaxID=1423790 RepID=I7KLD7_9LACO|nr:hypothetical protein [Lactobacillus pasteurii]KRK07221.1 hypothetical protein FC52_GL000883 [Lactobacillus pasteurii DSM 23907 = CRBIP 24.76]TDG76592.1 hypothetical protein C5L33_001351 [Lactobacillus pasteurii]CCI85314.1 Protein of unknown function [Lactobacillus pasteurii DSM 23907 = CRBIP 24.76]